MISASDDVDGVDAMVDAIGKFDKCPDIFRPGRMQVRKLPGIADQSTKAEGIDERSK